MLSEIFPQYLDWRLNMVGGRPHIDIFEAWPRLGPTGGLEVPPWLYRVDIGEAGQVWSPGSLEPVDVHL